MYDLLRAISERRCPVPLPIDWVAFGKALRAAVRAGYLREDHGCFDQWGGYSVTEKGVQFLRTYHLCTDCGGSTKDETVHDCPTRRRPHPYRT